MNILAGDFNGDLGCAGGPRGVRKCTTEGEIIRDFVRKYDFFPANLTDDAIGPVNTFYGPNSESCLDYILVPNYCKEIVKECETMELDTLNTSDHLPVCATLCIHHSVCRVNEVPIGSRVKWSKIPADKLNDLFVKPATRELKDLYNIWEHSVPTEADVDVVLEIVVDIIRRAEDRLPKSKFARHLKPFWSEGLNDLKHKKLQCYKAWCAAGRPKEVDNRLNQDKIKSKKAFSKRIRELSRQYENQEIKEAITASELNREFFWKLLKRKNSGNKAKVSAIRNRDKKVVHDIDSILEVWRLHFSELSKPRFDDSFDHVHYVEVMAKIHEWNGQQDSDEFSRDFFTRNEVVAAINKLNSGKAAGHDGILKEHLKALGGIMADFLVLIFRWVFILEYVPTNFRRGVQVPLFKGKNASTLDPDNYRGITLLSTFNKVFEILLWARLELWWHRNQVISPAQGACRKGASSVHTAMMLQETIASGLETNNKIFVLYLDVSKAFDSVWTEGLFFQLHALGVTGRTWRLMYRTYVNFKCRVRVMNRMSKWYPMLCGIHQGGFLSLIKYVIFINSLLVELQSSKVCCTINRISTSPLSYADDLAAASTQKRKIDRALEIANNHSLKWRYRFNAGKSAILVYGESKNEGKINSSNRSYSLGKDFVKEKVEYDHVGYKTCIHGDNPSRTVEKIKKGRRTLNASTGLGIRKGGLTLSTCNVIMWSVIIPIITYASEIWVMKYSDVKMLDEFQKYAGRRIQRFPLDTPNETSVIGLGWMRLENYIHVKKLLFLRTIAIRDDSCIYKSVLKCRAVKFNDDIRNGINNEHDSPIFDILRVAVMYKLYEKVMRMIFGGVLYSKHDWKKVVWSTAWCVEDEDWAYRAHLFKSTITIKRTTGEVAYLVWWFLSDNFPKYMRECEIMSRIVCHCSRLKVDDYRFKNSGQMLKSCTLCDRYEVEDAEHIILRCASLEDIRAKLFRDIENMANDAGVFILRNSENLIDTILGKPTPDVAMEHMCTFWIIVCQAVSRMYTKVLKTKQGIG